MVCDVNLGKSRDEILVAGYPPSYFRCLRFLTPALLSPHRSLSLAPTVVLARASFSLSLQGCCRSRLLGEWSVLSPHACRLGAGVLIPTCKDALYKSEWGPC